LLEVGGYFDLDGLGQKIGKLEQEIAQPGFWNDQENAQTVSRQYENSKSDLNSWQFLKTEVDDLSQLIEAIDGDLELVHEIEEKLGAIEKEFNQLEFQVMFAGPYDKEGAVLSIHAGTGGVDAQDWSEILLRMYTRFCQIHDFDVKIIERTMGNEAGIKNVVLEISGRHAYGWLKSENGVHRLVRISPFDSEKMRHTSFALVEVLPDLETNNEIEIKDDDLRIDVMRAGGHGGQSVNTTDSAVRMTHLPTGIVVKCQNERSQMQNRKTALKVLKGKLLKYYSKQEDDKIKEIKGEYQQAEWGSQARSYVMQPYQLVKDHRTEYETAEITKVLDGDLDGFVEEYLRSKAKK
jgi:peptide chain release factor 2